MAKLSKMEVDYGPAKGADRCEKCEHYLDPRQCELVAGDIDPAYWCEKFEARAMTDTVSTTLRVALAETWAFFFEAQSFHWNVTGSDFPQLHRLFGDVYHDASYEVDGLAEQLRALNEVAPTSLAEIDEKSKITFADTVPDSRAMVQKLAADNDLLIRALDDAQKAASSEHAGLANYLQDLLNRHQKTAWMLKATATEMSVKSIAGKKDERIGALLEAIKPAKNGTGDGEAG